MQKTVLSTADVARLFNVTETTVKRWADDGTLKCQKTPGGHRKFPMKFIVEFSSEHNYEPVGALSLTEGDAMAWTIETAMLRRDFIMLRQAFVEKALSPDQTDLFHYFSYLYQHHVQLWEIYDLILRPGMEIIGERWSRGEIDIGHEHRASYEVLDAMARLQAQVHVRECMGYSVICACMEDEIHEIGLRAASYLFESEGWKVHYFGARMPAASLIAAARQLRPTALCISLTGRDQQRRGLATLEHLIDTVHRNPTLVFLGGSGVADDVVKATRCDGAFRSAKELIDHLRTCFRSPLRDGDDRHPSL